MLVPGPAARRRSAAALAVLALLTLLTVTPSPARATPPNLTTSAPAPEPTPTFWVRAPEPTAPATPLPRPAGSPFDDAVGGRRLGLTGPAQVDTAPTVPPLPQVDAAAFVVADLDSGAVLAARNAHLPLPPASTIKTLTGLALLPSLDKGDVYLASQADAAVDGSRVGLVPDASYTVDALFHALFLQSGNDAARALGEKAGGQGQTVRLMTAEAGRIGAFDTVVTNDSGLDDPRGRSSTYDLALVARAGLQRPDFAAYVSTRTYPFPKPDGTTFEIQNQNRLLTRYPGAIGVKTGYTTQARRTFVGAAERDGHRLVVVVMRTDQPSADVAAGLLDWGFAARPGAAPVGRLVTPGQVAAAIAAAPAGRTTAPSPTATSPAGAASRAGPSATAGTGHVAGATPAPAHTRFGDQTVAQIAGHWAADRVRVAAWDQPVAGLPRWAWALVGLGGLLTLVLTARHRRRP